MKDGLLENPTRCKFDPAVLQCRSAGDTGCLSAPQVETARLIYSGVKNPKTGREIAGLLPGSELGWTDTGWTASARATGLDQFRFIVFANPSWTVQQFNADADIARAEEVDGNIVNALDPNVKPFIDRGGKLIQYHGWSDPQISPASSVQYYARAVEASGGAAKVSASYRLFMAPGMGHCGGGEGPNTFDMVSALEQWVEAGKAPDQILASHATGGRVDRTRPLCPYPQVAVYKGSGSIDEAANFACRAPSAECAVAKPAVAPGRHLARLTAIRISGHLDDAHLHAAGAARAIRRPGVSDGKGSGGTDGAPDRRTRSIRWSRASSAPATRNGVSASSRTIRRTTTTRSGSRRLTSSHCRATERRSSTIRRTARFRR